MKAVWCKGGKEQKGDPEGVLYLTDQRLIFEQKEEIATKKVLFVVTEKQKVQGLQLEAPVALVEKVDASKQGMLKNEDHIEIRFLSGAPVQTGPFPHLEGRDCLAGTHQPGQDARTSTRAVRWRSTRLPLDKVKAAPAQCPSCGSTITTVVLRGMDTIKCEYCGLVIRL